MNKQNDPSTMAKMAKQQLELAFDASVEFRPVVRQSRRSSRARWWFEQMHQIVDRAFDWRVAPPARPEQGHFAFASERSF